MLIALNVLLIFMASTFFSDLQQSIYDLRQEVPTKIQDDMDEKTKLSIEKPSVKKSIDHPRRQPIKGKQEVEKEGQGMPNSTDATNEKSSNMPKDKVSNILLVGLDKRQGEDGRGRADAIIIVSMNSRKNAINLISFMRDTYVSIPGYRANKINAAYSLGGVKLLKDTIHKNFKLNIDQHAVVNFIGFEKMINTLGGVQVTIKDYEIREFNRCLDDVKKGPGNYIHKSGPTLLNGAQTLAYVRMRKVGDGDYERTQRQRKVMQVMIEKSKEISLFKYPVLLANLLPNVRTNVSLGDSLSLLKDYYAIKNWTISGTQVPTADSGQPKMIRSMWVIDPDEKKCTEIIKKLTE